MSNKFTECFSTCHNDAEIRAVFRQLAMKNHPDCGGDNESMRLLIEAYKEALKAVDGSETISDDGKSHIYRYHEQEEEELIEKIKEVFSVKAKNQKDWRVLLIGTWLWLDRTEKEDKDLLNKNGLCFWWSGDKEMWYWHSKFFAKKYYNGKGDLLKMALKYGYSEIRDTKQKSQNSLLQQ